MSRWWTINRSQWWVVDLFRRRFINKHAFSVKPLGRISAESAAMLALLQKYPDVVAGLNFATA